MHIWTVQILVILSTFGRHRSVIARSLSQRTSSKDENSCLVNGELHPLNSLFTTSDCSMQCYCSLGGVASCLDLSCSQTSPVECPPGSTLQEVEEPVGSGGVRCSCKKRSCIPAKVICYRQDNEETYKVGERFTLGNCSQSCMCNENGEISCVPMCSKIKCPKRTRPRGKGFVEQKESGCSCEIQECVPVPRKFCRVDGRRFRRGRVFITKDCRRKCRCRKNGIPRCTPLCKTTQKVSKCSPDERLEGVLDFFAGGRCSCERKICIPNRRDNWTESKVTFLERKN